MTLHAMHCKAERPHLSLQKGQWVCFFKGRVHWGCTPELAFCNWYAAYARVTGTPPPLRGRP